MIGGFFLTRQDLSFYSYLSNSQPTIFETITMEGLNDAGVVNVFQHSAREITKVSFAFMHK